MNTSDAHDNPVMGRWGVRAAARYAPECADEYRTSDDAVMAGEAGREMSRWLTEVCRTFQKPISVLDVGCGTGRYFSALTGVRELVGLDASQAMLDRARAPLAAERITAERVTLVRGDVDTVEFDREQFDMICSVGVLAEHVPLTDVLVGRLASWLTPGGALAFTAVHPDSPSIPRTWKRRVAAPLIHLLSNAVPGALRAAWLSNGFYADESRVRDLVAHAGLKIESLRRLQDVHLHLLAVARKTEKKPRT